MIIDELFESLYEGNQGKKTISYGKELHVTESQTKALVALSHIFPQRLTAAIELIEGGWCREYVSGTRKTLVIEKFVVSTRLWSCPCHDFLKQVVRIPSPSCKWQRVCKHVLAAFIIQSKFPIMDHTVVESVELSTPEMVTLNLYGMLPPQNDVFVSN